VHSWLCQNRYTICSGLDEDHHIIEAVEIARGIHPGTHFHRIVPSKIVSGISPVTTDLKEITLIEEKVRQFMYSNEVVQDDLKVTMEKKGPRILNVKARSLVRRMCLSQRL